MTGTNLKSQISEATLSCVALLKYLKKDITPPTDIKEGERNETIYQYACKLAKKRVSKEDAELLVLAMAKACEPPYPEKEALRSLESAYSGKNDNTANDTVDEDGMTEITHKMNEYYAVVLYGGKCLVLRISKNPINGETEFTFMAIYDLRNYYANKCEIVHGKKKTHADIWFEHPKRKEYEGIIFSPNKKNHKGYLNLWKGYGCEPIKGDCSLFLKHIRTVICNNDEDLYNYVIAWLADLVQNPSERTGTALVLRGAQGTGKGVFAKTVGSLFGQHFLHITHSRHLTGHFNVHLMSKCLVFADEAVWGGNKSEEGVLKALVTEETIPIEAKGRDVINVRYYIN